MRAGCLLLTFKQLPAATLDRGKYGIMQCTVHPRGPTWSTHCTRESQVPRRCLIDRGNPGLVAAACARHFKRSCHGVSMLHGDRGSRAWTSINLHIGVPHEYVTSASRTQTDDSFTLDSRDGNGAENGAALLLQKSEVVTGNLDQLTYQLSTFALVYIEASTSDQGLQG